MEVHWFLPTRGDSRDVGPATTDRGHDAAALRRRPTLAYLTAVAQAAEQSGFGAVLTPTGSGCEDAWVVCSALAATTERLDFPVAFRPGFVLPALATQQAATFQRLSGGRLRLNIVTRAVCGPPGAGGMIYKKAPASIAEVGALLGLWGYMPRQTMSTRSRVGCRFAGSPPLRPFRTRIFWTTLLRSARRVSRSARVHRSLKVSPTSTTRTVGSTGRARSSFLSATGSRRWRMSAASSSSSTYRIRSAMTSR